MVPFERFGPCGVVAAAMLVWRTIKSSSNFVLDEVLVVYRRRLIL